jgi:hypothetical protein
MLIRISVPRYRMQNQLLGENILLECCEQAIALIIADSRQDHAVAQPRYGVQRL